MNIIFKTLKLKEDCVIVNGIVNLDEYLKWNNIKQTLLTTQVNKDG